MKLFGKKSEETLVVSDTTVQRNNTTFPTDARLYKKVIDGCNKIARTEGIAQRQTYTQTGKELLRATYNSILALARHSKDKVSQVIVAIKAFEWNPHDSKTIEPLLEQLVSGNRKLPETLAYDRGGRGAKEVRGALMMSIVWD